MLPSADCIHYLLLNPNDAATWSNKSEVLTALGRTTEADEAGLGVERP